MYLKSGQLADELKNNLASIYFVSGDEPLQLGESADLIRKAAKNSKYNSRETFAVDAHFEWNQLVVTTDTLSIFANKKLIELTLYSTKLGQQGTKAFTDYCQHLTADTLLLVIAPKLDKATLKTQWFQKINKIAVVIQVWPLEGRALIQWLQSRAYQRGLQLEADAINCLATRVEGHLLAAAQEIEKLYILYGNKVISKQTLETVVAENARFDVFKLIDSVLSGRACRATYILNHLKAEGISAVLVLWALTREARLLIAIKIGLDQGQNKHSIFQKYRVWDQRVPLINYVLTHVKMNDLQTVLLLGAKTDRQIKGQQLGDYWETLLSICALFYRRA